MNTIHKRRIPIWIIELLLASMLIIACNGSGDDDDGQQQGSSIFPPAVFIADKDVNGIDELFVAFQDGAEIIKLSDPLVAGGNVVAFKISPDGIYVAYVADQDTAGLFELYVVPVDKSGNETAVKVSVSVEGIGIKEICQGSGDYVFAWASDSSRIAYIADAADLVVGFFELFSSTPDGKEKNLISDLVDTNSDVQDFEWAPNSTLIAYVADQRSPGLYELYVSPNDSNTPNFRISGPINGVGIKEISFGEFAFAWAPDSTRIAYIADQDRSDKFELYTALPNGSDNILVSGPLLDERDVDAFAWAPDSSRIVYRANQDFLNALELYTVFPDSALSSQRVTSGFDRGQNVRQFGWSPTAINLEQRIAFIADKNIQGRFQLWTTSPNDSNNVLVSSVGVAGGEVKAFAWSPDGLQLAFLGDTRSDEVFELFTTRRALPEINPVSFPNSGAGDVDVRDFAWAPNGSRIAYRADRRTDDTIELYTNLPNGDMLSNALISDNLLPGGKVQEFKWAPDSSGVGYIADQDTITVEELFASQPDGGNNSLLSGTLVSGGDVLSFDWVP